MGPAAAHCRGPGYRFQESRARRKALFLSPFVRAGGDQVDPLRAARSIRPRGTLIVPPHSLFLAPFPPRACALIVPLVLGKNFSFDLRWKTLIRRNRGYIESYREGGACKEVKFRLRARANRN